MDIIIERASIDDIDKLMEWRMEVLHNVFDISESTQNLYTANREYYHNSFQAENTLLYSPKSIRQP